MLDQAHQGIICLHILYTRRRRFKLKQELAAPLAALQEVETHYIHPQEEMKLKQELAGPMAALQETARAIVEVQRECRLEVDPAKKKALKPTKNPFRNPPKSNIHPQEEIKLKQELAGPLAALQETARAIAEVQRECKLEIDPAEYVESFRPTLMDIIHAWSKVGGNITNK